MQSVGARGDIGIIDDGVIGEMPVCFHSFQSVSVADRFLLIVIQCHTLHRQMRVGRRKGEGIGTGEADGWHIARLGQRIEIQEDVSIIGSDEQAVLAQGQRMGFGEGDTFGKESLAFHLETTVGIIIFGNGILAHDIEVTLAVTRQSYTDVTAQSVNSGIGFNGQLVFQELVGLYAGQSSAVSGEIEPSRPIFGNAHDDIAAQTISRVVSAFGEIGFFGMIEIQGVQSLVTANEQDMPFHYMHTAHSFDGSDTDGLRLLTHGMFDFPHAATQ